MRVAPDFVLIGAMKAGSTSLHRQLEAHPRLFLTRPKEPEFFSLRYEEPGAADWYRGLFRRAQPEQRLGEASTGYTRWPQIQGVPERLAAANPDVRLVYMLRAPVERAVSHWRHRMLEEAEAGRAPRPLGEALADWPEIVDSSRYLRQVEQYLRCLPREQLLVVTLDEMGADAPGTLARIQRFLGVDVDPRLGSRRLHANRAGELGARREVVRGIRRLEALPGARRLARLLPGDVRGRLRRRLLDAPTPARWLRALRGAEPVLPPVGEEDLARLHALLDAETAELEAWLGRALPETWTRRGAG
jgi:hypothetical protein